MTDNKKIEKYITAGLVGSVITVCGEMLQGCVASTDNAGRMAKLFSSFDNLPVWRIGMGSTVGAIGILLQFFGMYAIYLSFKDKSTAAAKIFRIGMYNFSVIGAIIHVLMSVMVFTYKSRKNLIKNADNICYSHFIIHKKGTDFSVPLVVLLYFHGCKDYTVKFINF